MTGVVTLTGWLVVNSDLEYEDEVEVEVGGRRVEKLGKYIEMSWLNKLLKNCLFC